MKRIIAVILVILLSVSTAGCIKHGSSPIYADQSSVKTNAENAGSPFDRFEAPEYWSDRIEKDDLTVIVDADVVVPDSGLFQTTVITADEITQELADRIRTTLIGDAVLFRDAPPTRPYTKAEIRYAVDHAFDFLDDPHSTYNLDIPKDSPEAKAYLARIQEQIEYWEEQYKTAPEAFEPGPADIQFTSKPDIDRPDLYSHMQIWGTATLDDGREALLNIVKGDDIVSSFVVFYSGPYNIEDSSWDSSRYGVPLIDAGITMEQASEKAIQTVRDMGVDYLYISSVEEQRIIDRGNDGMAVAVRPCYKFYLTRNINGITENYAIGKNATMIHNGNSRFAASETATITIAKEGVIQFLWDGPTRILRTENENLALLSFEDIQAIFNMQIFMDNTESDLGTWMEMMGVAVSDRKITIEEARLGLMRVPGQGPEEETLLIPVWDFYGYETYKLLDPKDADRKQFTINENGEVVSTIAPFHVFGKSLLTLNAVDGSVIDRM